jgi:hypothetical protein
MVNRAEGLDPRQTQWLTTGSTPLAPTSEFASGTNELTLRLWNFAQHGGNGRHPRLDWAGTA